MARSPIPFATSEPLDSLEIEQIANDEVLIGSADLDLVDDDESAFDSNIANDIPEKDLDEKAAMLIGLYTFRS